MDIVDCARCLDGTSHGIGIVDHGRGKIVDGLTVLVGELNGIRLPAEQVDKIKEAFVLIEFNLDVIERGLSSIEYQIQDAKDSLRPTKQSLEVFKS